MSTSFSTIDSTTFKPGDRLPLETDYLWLIISGVVKSYTVSSEGTSITLGFWGTEDLVGLPLSPIAPYTLKCINEVKAIAIPRPQWSELSRNMFYHAQQTQQLIYIVRSTRIHQRLWLLLKWLAHKFGRAIEQGKLIDFRLTHQELANAINTTRITVTKTLNQFEQEGLIVRQRSKSIIIRSWC